MAILQTKVFKCFIQNTSMLSKNQNQNQQRVIQLYNTIEIIITIVQAFSLRKNVLKFLYNRPEKELPNEGMQAAL